MLIFSIHITDLRGQYIKVFYFQTVIDSSGWDFWQDFVHPLNLCVNNDAAPSNEDRSVL